MAPLKASDTHSTLLLAIMPYEISRDRDEGGGCVKDSRGGGDPR
jgi:hypothetical protein